MPVPATILNSETGEIREGTVGCDKCGYLACVCAIERRHAKDCKFRRAATGIAIACEHGRDVCPSCDPCTCGVEVTREDFVDESVTEVAGSDG